MDYAVDMMVGYDVAHGVEIGNVGADECIVGGVLYVSEVGEVSGVCEFVEIHDVVIRILVDEQAHNVRADESGAAGDEDVTFHSVFSCFGFSGFRCRRRANRASMEFRFRMCS